MIMEPERSVKPEFGERTSMAETMDRLEDAVRECHSSLKTGTGGKGGLPTIDEIEEILKELRSKTRDIYLDMVSDFIHNIDESELIESKKANTGKRG